MSDILPHALIFYGSGLPSSEEFIRYIRQRALVEGAHKDDELVAATAAACLGGDALHWYEEELEESTQESWKELRKAILKKWPAGGGPGLERPPDVHGDDNANAGQWAHNAAGEAAFASGSLAPGPSTIPTPAAAAPPLLPPASASASALPLPLVSGTRGRIKIEAGDPSLCGYISADQSPNGLHYGTKLASNAAVVRIGSNPQALGCFLYTSPSDGMDELLGLTWQSNHVSQDIQQAKGCWSSIATLTHRKHPSQPWFTTSTFYKGESDAAVWNIAFDGRLTILREVTVNKVKLKKELTVAIWKATGNIDVTTDWSDWNKENRKKVAYAVRAPRWLAT